MAIGPGGCRGIGRYLQEMVRAQFDSKIGARQTQENFKEKLRKLFHLKEAGSLEQLFGCYSDKTGKTYREFMSAERSILNELRVKLGIQCVDEQHLKDGKISTFCYSGIGPGHASLHAESTAVIKGNDFSEVCLQFVM